VGNGYTDTYMMALLDYISTESIRVGIASIFFSPCPPNRIDDAAVALFPNHALHSQRSW
jgi:hypothetical protein